MWGWLLFALALGIVWMFMQQSLRESRRRLAREAFIRHGALPLGLFERLRQKHPQLSLKDCQLIANGLRQLFLFHHKSGFKFVFMPSLAVDDLWHEFFLYAKDYDAFCQQAFGHFLHHTPSVVLSQNQNSNEGLRRCWWFACKEENINPRAPIRWPLLFALDKKFNIRNGFYYEPDSSGVRRKADNNGDSFPYFGGDFSSYANDSGTNGFTSGSVEASGFNDVDAGSGCGGASGSDGVDGGSGCGGGGGGD